MIVLRLFSLIVVLLAVPNLTVANEENGQFKIIKTEYGSVRGKLMSTIYDAKPYYSFFGIPYAKPPINELRFKAPVAPTPWTNTLDTLKYGSECVQVSYFTNQPEGSEDCLFLNVLVPANIKPNTKLPVLFYIHGGGFFAGSAGMATYELLVNHDVIVVAINYRLGALGFLSLGTADYSGNMGLKDQLFAMQWVQQNIEQFGGDKDLVTIIGASAGAASVDFHVLSPKSKGLFKRAIIQGGSAISPWALYEKSNHLDTVYDLAKKLGHKLENIDEVIEFLKRVEPDLLTKETNPMLYTPGAARKEAELVWAPIVEVDAAIDPFFTKHPREYLDDHSTKQPIDILQGYCRDEMGNIIFAEILNPSLLETFNEKFELQFPRSELRNDYNSKDYLKLAQEIRDFYLKKTNGIVTNETVKEFNDLMSDIWFVYPTDQEIKSQVKRITGNIFYYLYSLPSNFAFGPPLPFSAIPHGSDSFYVIQFEFPGMKEKFENFKEGSFERENIKLMTNMWTNFAKYGNPTPNADPVIFRPVREDSINYVEISENGLIAGVQPFPERMEFWDQFYKKNDEILKEMMKTRQN